MSLPPFVKPSQYNETPVCSPTSPIPGPSAHADSQVPLTENDSTHEHEPEGALAQSAKDTLACNATPCLFIIIDNMPVRSPPEKSTLIPTMRLCRNSLTCTKPS
ncbi:hypothetical protein O181_038626 [Austropuccinia psidii MF-1]|uniref:Uncharacterized protein n=1 Tax=Austropuccinia psidii MF-1 TaxID=1389203 RepID=A0A9Q3HBT5_9BASI|nr:hypothetical protein [Austropuccinia psidii MF-1]